MTNKNILSQRYASVRMNQIFSETGKTIAERDLWIAVMKAQRELGVDIPGEAIEMYEAARDDVDLARIEEIERETRHDIKAKIQAFVEVAGAGEHIHRGMTSRDLSDNVEQLQIRQASELVFGRYVSVLRHMINCADSYDEVIVARTHHQAAQPTTLGRRFAMWADELMTHMQDFEDHMHNYALRGIKGPVGTQLDMAEVLGSPHKVNVLEQKVAGELGFSKVSMAPGQVYPRSSDYSTISKLAALSSACESFAKTMRLMAGYELVTEGFKEGQVGSTAMPHKRNTRSSERICGFSELLKMYADGASRISGDQWEEGDVSCSVVRRVVIPDSFYASDGLCETTLTVLNELGAYPAVIEAELDRYLPFLATTRFLTMAVGNGLGREEAHKAIKKHAVSEAIRISEQGGSPNLVGLLSSDPLFVQAGITSDDITRVLQDRESFTGNANSQIDSVTKKAQHWIDKYPTEAAYEPGNIL